MSTLSDPAFWPPAFSAAIFDFDGTLADTAEIWNEVDRTFLARRGLAWSSDLSAELAMRGFWKGAEYVIARFGLDERPQDICDEWNELGAQLYRDEVRLRPGAPAYLRELGARGVPLALATTNDRAVLGAMRHVDVASLFDAVVCGAEVAHGKDEPDIYLEAARRLGVRPERCIVFEDIAAGIDSARSVGMTTCALRTRDPGQDFDDLRRRADLCLDRWE